MCLEVRLRVRTRVWESVRERLDVEWRMEDMWRDVECVWESVDWMICRSSGGRWCRATAFWFTLEVCCCCCCCALVCSGIIACIKEDDVESVDVDVGVDVDVDVGMGPAVNAWSLASRSL